MSIQEYYSSECFLYTLCWKHRSYVIPCMLALIYQSIDLLTYFSQPSKLCTEIDNKNVPKDSFLWTFFSIENSWDCCDVYVKYIFVYMLFHY